MSNWRMEVFLTRGLAPGEYESLREIPGMSGVCHDVGREEASLFIDVSAANRQDAELAARLSVESVLPASDIARVGGADDIMQNRQVLLWVRATRNQLRVWESAIAVVIRANLSKSEPADYEIWDVQIHRHLALVAVNNLVRAIDNSDDRYSAMSAAMRDNVRNLRDLQEHWDEQWPAFYNATQPGQLKRGGAVFASRHPGRSPYDFIGWNSDTGPELGPDLVLTEIEAYLDLVEREVLSADPSLGRFVTPPPPSPWVGVEVDPSAPWWPRP